MKCWKGFIAIYIVGVAWLTVNSGKSHFRLAQKQNDELLVYPKCTIIWNRLFFGGCSAHLAANMEIAFVSYQIGFMHTCICGLYEFVDKFIVSAQITNTQWKRISEWNGATNGRSVCMWSNGHGCKCVKIPYQVSSGNSAIFEWQFTVENVYVFVWSVSSRRFLWWLCLWIHNSSSCVKRSCVCLAFQLFQRKLQ